MGVPVWLGLVLIKSERVKGVSVSKCGFMWLVGHWEHFRGLFVRSSRFSDKEKGNYMRELQQMGKKHNNLFI